MSLTKPKAVRPGSTFGIVSPASTPRPELVKAGILALNGLGYKTKLFQHALERGPLYYAGTTIERVQDLHAAFKDDEVDAVICTRGGWGSAELLPLLDRELIQRHPKAFLGYSDQTSIHLWLRHEASLVSFQAPMVAADFSKAEGFDPGSWRSALEDEATWSLGSAEGLRVLKRGEASGELHGGCLSIYAESLGTPWAARPLHGILMLEDIGVKPYQWDRMLVHLRHAGLLENVTGIVFGDMAQCGDETVQTAIEAAILHALSHFPGPIGIGLQSGHVERRNVTLPFGVDVRLNFNNAEDPRITFLEAAVRG